MTRQIRRWAVPCLALIILGLILGSCGRVEPTFQPGNIYVTSVPAGAAIFLDGTDTGKVTPDTLIGLDIGNYMVSVALEGFLVNPAVQDAIVTPLRTTQLQEFALSQTSLLVTSIPEGASIYIDGEDTGLVTPASVVGVAAGTVEVSLMLEGYLVSPATYSATVVESHNNEIPDDTFAFRAIHTTLFEGFSNVSCQGCPDMAINMADVMHRPGHGLDRLLYIKYSMQWPSINDPHYVYNTTENDDRMFYYIAEVGAGIPVLAMEGVKLSGTAANSTPNADEIEPYLAASQALDPGFLIDVTADWTNTAIPVEVTISALDDVSLAGKTLFVALVQTEIHYEDPPGSEGETEFHYVFRDRADTVDPLTDLTAGQTQTINTTLVRDDWNLDTLLVIAFVQDDSDKSIFQAGSTEATLNAPAQLFINNNHHNQVITAGGERP